MKIHPTRAIALVCLASSTLLACAEEPEEDDLLPAPADTASETFLPSAPSDSLREVVEEAAIEVREGEATFYADHFEGRRTASGRTFRQTEMVAAHKAFPFGTRLRVTNLRNEREVEVEVVDRGPFAAGSRPAAEIDLSRTAAERLGIVREGRARVRVEVLSWG